jgi:hypothetical protein
MSARELTPIEEALAASQSPVAVSETIEDILVRSALLGAAPSPEKTAKTPAQPLVPGDEGAYALVVSRFLADEQPALDPETEAKKREAREADIVARGTIRSRYSRRAALALARSHEAGSQHIRFVSAHQRLPLGGRLPSVQRARVSPLRTIRRHSRRTTVGRRLARRGPPRPDKPSPRRAVSVGGAA